MVSWLNSLHFDLVEEYLSHFRCELIFWHMLNQIWIRYSYSICNNHEFNGPRGSVFMHVHAHSHSHVCMRAQTRASMCALGAVTYTHGYLVHIEAPTRGYAYMWVYICCCTA